MKKIFVFIIFLALFTALIFKINSNGKVDRQDLQVKMDKLELLGHRYIWNNQRVNGLYTYSLNANTGVYNPTNNDGRQLIIGHTVSTSCTVSQMWCGQSAKFLDFVFANWYKEKAGVNKISGKKETHGYIFSDNKSNLGANAFFLLSLLHSPNPENYASQIGSLVRGIASLQNPDGSLNSYYIEPANPYDKEQAETYYAGEAMFALGEYYKHLEQVEKVENKSGERKKEANEVLNTLKKSGDFYIEKYGRLTREKFNQLYAPWQTRGLYALWQITGERKYADAIFILNDPLVAYNDAQIEKENKKFGTGKVGETHMSGFGVWLESLVVAYKVAKDVGDEQRQKDYLQSINNSIEFISKIQLTEKIKNSNTEFVAYEGGIPSYVNDFEIRIDNVAHILDAIREFKTK